MTTSHTPGPWSVIFNNNPSEDEITASDGDHVASTWSLSLRDLEERYANARLIAAAPELLAALRRIELAADNLGYAEGGLDGLGELNAASVEAAQAIARATGSQP